MSRQTASIAVQDAAPAAAEHPTGILQRKCDCGQHKKAGASCTACANERAASGYGGVLRRCGCGQSGRTCTSCSDTRSGVPPVVHDVLRSAGEPLDGGTRAFMESRFRHDFGRVRVHTDARAAESAQSVGALAYTVGNDVAFAAGQYKRGGSWLLAHELAHVVQQAGHETAPQSKLVIGESADASEQQADQIADAVMSGEHVPFGAAAASQAVLRRACGPTDIGTPSGCRSGRGTFVSGGPLFRFQPNCDDFDSAATEAFLRALPGTLPPNATVEIHGFASTDGDPGFNDNLSCARARKAESVLTSAGLAASRITATVRHGPTPGPAADRRSVVVLTRIPSTLPVPGPASTSCFSVVATRQFSRGNDDPGDCQYQTAFITTNLLLDPCACGTTGSMPIAFNYVALLDGKNFADPAGTIPETQASGIGSRMTLQDSGGATSGPLVHTTGGAAGDPGDTLRQTLRLSATLPCAGGSVSGTVIVGGTAPSQTIAWTLTASNQVVVSSAFALTESTPAGRVPTLTVDVTGGASPYPLFPGTPRASSCTCHPVTGRHLGAGCPFVGAGGGFGGP